jgi:hypothetical protein
LSEHKIIYVGTGKEDLQWDDGQYSWIVMATFDRKEAEKCCTRFIDDMRLLTKIEQEMKTTGAGFMSAALDEFYDKLVALKPDPMMSLGGFDPSTSFEVEEVDIAAAVSKVTPEALADLRGLIAGHQALVREQKRAIRDNQRKLEYSVGAWHLPIGDVLKRLRATGRKQQADDLMDHYRKFYSGSGLSDEQIERMFTVNPDHPCAGKSSA